MTRSARRIAVLVSGGVDSSLALARAVSDEPRAEVFALTMKHLPSHLAGERIGSCCSPRQTSLAKRLAERLGIAHYTLDFEEAFRAGVLLPTGAALASGVTPNPCVWCNERVKLGALLAAARRLGATDFVTGHYARLVSAADAAPRLARARDPKRDQSYFLHRVDPETRRHLSFPLGDLSKDEVRAEARARELPMAEEEDSTGVCFAPDADFRAALAGEFPEAFVPGPILERGAEVGRHGGIATLTIGKRRGAGLAPGATPGARRYVSSIDPATRTAVLAPREALDVREIRLGEVLLEAGVTLPGRFLVQIRAQSEAVPATAEPDGAGRARVRFDDPVFAPAPGQAAVFYDGDLVAGGGWILRP